MVGDVWVTLAKALTPLGLAGPTYAPSTNEPVEGVGVGDVAGAGVVVGAGGGVVVVVGAGTVVVAVVFTGGVVVVVDPGTVALVVVPPRCHR